LSDAANLHREGGRAGKREGVREREIEGGRE
jgi:hypothetical protein